jgi:hypothetical protein
MAMAARYASMLMVFHPSWSLCLLTWSHGALAMGWCLICMKALIAQVSCRS